MHVLMRWRKLRELIHQTRNHEDKHNDGGIGGLKKNSMAVVT